MDRRNKANHQTDQRGDPEPECENGAAHADGARPWKSGRTERHQRSHTELRHRHPERTADYGEQQALRDELPYESWPCRAQRGAHREFAAALRAPSEQQTRHVDMRSRALRPTAPKTASSTALTPRSPVLSVFTMRP
jgi:hypothetical protein